MQKRTEFARYNDGVVHIYRDTDRRSNFGAKLNVSTIDDLQFIAKLTYAEQSKRQQDVEFAQQQGFSLELKIKTRFIKGVDNKCKAVIGDMLYDISYIDTTRTEMYLYLHEIDKLKRGDGDA